MTSTEVTSLIGAVITALGVIIAAWIGVSRHPAGGPVTARDHTSGLPPEPPAPAPIGLAALFSVLAFACASIAVGLALARGKPPSPPLMLSLGIPVELLAAVAFGWAYRAVRQSRPEDRALEGYEVMITAFSAFIAIPIVS
jgi:hypothetical protein